MKVVKFVAELIGDFEAGVVGDPLVVVVPGYTGLVWDSDGHEMVPTERKPRILLFDVKERSPP